MIVLQLPSALSVDNRDYSHDRPRTLQNDSLLRRSILFLRMLIEEIKIATRQRCMGERKARVEATRELPGSRRSKPWICHSNGLRTTKTAVCSVGVSDFDW